jgi:antibiotic biosynthesis monooxygenase (ABM) superfamily enzyme
MQNNNASPFLGRLWEGWSRKMSTPAEGATLVVSRRIKPGQEQAYEDWLRRVIQAARAFPGYLGVTTLSPEGIDSDLRYLIWRFDNADTLEAWEKSDVRNKLVAEVQNYSIQHYEKSTGMETWFSLPGMKKVQAPPKWKMFTVTLFAAYFVSFVARLILGSYVGNWPLFESNLIFTAILVGTLTYFVMPRLSSLLRGWLYPKQS